MPSIKFPPSPQIPKAGNDYIYLLPDDLRLINLYGAEYYIPWEAIPVGGSVFLKTTADASEIAEHLERINKLFRCRFAANNRCEYGYFGIRIWRLS